MAVKARHHGAKGIGLCRTERMFNESERLPLMRNLILADSPEERKRWADKLMPMQRGDFVEIFRTMERAARHHSPAGPAAARISAQHRRARQRSQPAQRIQPIINALEQLPGTVTMLDPELYKFVPSIETVARELGEVKAKGLDQKLLARERKGAAPGPGARRIQPHAGQPGSALRHLLPGNL